MPDAKRSRIPDSFKYVEVKYYWEHCYLKHRLLKYVSYWLYLHSFLLKLKKNDKVYVAGEDDLLRSVLSKKSIDVFYEKTESPEVSLSGSHLYHPTLEEHIQLCKRVKALFLISTALKEFYIAHGVDEQKIHIINMTVDTDRFQGITKAETDSYIAYCGTVSNNKDGVDDLIRAFALVCASHPEVKLYIIGDTRSMRERSDNLQLIENLGITEKVVLTGRVDASDMPQLLLNAEVLALARPDNKQAKYGFPTKLGEYLMTGNPVVVTAVGDIPLFLEDRVSGLIVPPSNHQQFAEKLKWALENQELAKEIGKKGKEVAKRSFNSYIETEKMMRAIQGIYDEIE